MEILGVVVCTSRVMKVKERLPFCREFRTLCIEDRVAVDLHKLSNFEWANREIWKPTNRMMRMRWRGVLVGQGKLDRDDKGGKETLRLRYCSINIWDRSELKLAWSREISSYFEIIFQWFYYLVIRIHQFLRFLVFYVEYFS